MGLAPYIPRQFKNVFTGRYANHQRALKKGEIKRVLLEDVVEEEADRSSRKRTCRIL